LKLKENKGNKIRNPNYITTTKDPPSIYKVYQGGNNKVRTIFTGTRPQKQRKKITINLCPKW